MQIVIPIDRGDIAQIGILPVQNIEHVDGLEAIFLHVDDVDVPLRILADGFRRRFRSQLRVAERDQARVIIADAIDGARAEAPDEPQPAVRMRP